MQSRWSQKFSWWAAAGVSLLSACTMQVQNPKVNIGPPSVNISGDTGSGTGSTSGTSPGSTTGSSSGSTTGSVTGLSCNAALATANGIAQTGQAASIQVVAQGGVGPYFVAGADNTFAAQTTLSRTYTNPTDSNQTQTDQVIVMDSSGDEATCSFQFTVAPAAGTGSGFSCTVASEYATPRVNDIFPVLISVSGGTAPYNISFNPGTNGSEIGSLTAISSTQAAAQVTYAAAGTSTATATITDKNGQAVTCSQNISVHSQLGIQVTASPGSSAPSNQSITLTAQAVGNASTATYTFTSTSTNVSIQQTGATAVITSNSQQAQNFSVVVAAAADGTEVNVTVPLAFTSVQSNPLTCQLSATGTYGVNNTVTYSLTASTGEQLQVLQFNPGTGGTTVDTLSATYATGGWETASVVARSASTGQYCNNGNALTAQVYIYGALSCSVNVAASTVATGQSFYVWATVPASGAPGNVTITNVSSIAGSGFSLNWPNASSAPEVAFSNSGSFPIYLTVQDGLGRSATCSTTEVVD